MEYEILNSAIKKIEELQGVSCQILEEEIINGAKKIDAEIVLTNRQRKLKYYVEIKNKIVPAQIPRMIELTKDLKPLLIVANYISPKAKELLRLSNIAYVDTAGNMFIRNEDLYIHIQTKNTNRDKLNSSGRAFKKAGSKVVYQLLINPTYLNKPYREIGLKSTVTIDTVSKVMQDLLVQKLILQTNSKTFQFNDRKRLFEEWVKGFNQNTRPKLKQGRFSLLDKNIPWKHLELPYDTYWGGSGAAELLGTNLIADRLLIYTGKDFQAVMKELRIIPDENGEILLIEKFWSSVCTSLKRVHPVLVYADLLEDTNPRYLQVSKNIYKNYVEEYL